jgi:hypothetical protein
MIGLAYAFAAVILLTTVKTNQNKQLMRPHTQQIYNKAASILTLIHIAWTLLIVAMIDDLSDKYFMLVSSDIIYYITQICIIIVKNNYNSNDKLYLAHHMVTIFTLMYFFNDERREIKRFIIKLIMLLNMSTICLDFYFIAKRYNTCRNLFKQILVIAFFVARIIGFPTLTIYSVVNRKTKNLLSTNESIALVVLGIVFYIVNWRWFINMVKTEDSGQRKKRVDPIISDIYDVPSRSGNKDFSTYISNESSLEIVDSNDS